MFSPLFSEKEPTRTVQLPQNQFSPPASSRRLLAALPLSRHLTPVRHTNEGINYPIVALIIHSHLMHTAQITSTAHKARLDSHVTITY